ncbi:VanW family protein, partial [Oscillospiraceae bacterium OttesenSCG-928-F05]|nr:VanW family protein [Oscillospiraceae bacterium OttesenSCG-928-F05]
LTTADFTEIDLEAMITEIPPVEIDLDAVLADIRTEPVNAALDTTNQDDPQVIPHVDGRHFDIAEARTILAGTPEGEPVRVPLIFTAPEINTEQLRSTLFQDVLAEVTTSLNAGNVNRTGNIRLTAKAISGMIMNPGDVFSYNGVVGERTTAKGYRDASVYSAGEISDQLGGGICQTSSTLYMAVLRADLEITNRHNHMYTVVYAPLGEDATVYWGSLDFKFTNNRQYPIKLEVWQHGSYVSVRIWGTKTDNNTVEIQTMVHSKTPYSTIERANPELAPGVRKQVQEGHSAVVCSSVRVVKDENGNVIRKDDLGRSTYRRLDRIIEYGPQPGEVTPTDAPPETTPDPTIPTAPPDPNGTPVPTDPPPAGTPIPTDPPVTTESPATPPPTEAPPANTPASGGEASGGDGSVPQM